MGIKYVVNSHCMLRSDHVCSRDLQQDKGTSGLLLQSPDRSPVVLPWVRIKYVKSKGVISRDCDWTDSNMSADAFI
jgi:hypothetical protein